MGWLEDKVRNVQEEQENIIKSQLGDFEKARSGIYADTFYNRKKGIVGQKYGGKKQEEGKKEFKKLDGLVTRSGIISKILYPLHSKAEGFLYYSDGTRVSNKGTLERLQTNPNKLVSILDVTGTMGNDNISREQMKDKNIAGSYHITRKGSDYILTVNKRNE